jgi:penicillin-binding protein 1A
MEQVLKDNSLKNYRAHFPKPKEKINKEYGCRTIYHRKDTDSIATDSLINTLLEE